MEAPTGMRDFTQSINITPEDDINGEKIIQYRMSCENDPEYNIGLLGNPTLEGNFSNNWRIGTGASKIKVIGDDFWANYKRNDIYTITFHDGWTPVIHIYIYGLIYIFR